MNPQVSLQSDLTMFKFIKDVLTAIGDYILLIARVLWVTFTHPPQWVLIRDQMYEIGKEYKFLMQMSNIISSDGMVQGLTHWSYMESVTRTSYEYQNLPGVGISVPEFISLFE